MHVLQQAQAAGSCEGDEASPYFGCGVVETLGCGTVTVQSAADAAALEVPSLPCVIMEAAPLGSLQDWLDG